MRRLVVLAMLAACGGEARRGEEAARVIPEPPADAIVKTTDGGKGSVTISVWPATPTLGDSIWLRLDASAGPGLRLELPFDQLALGRFSVLGYHSEPGRRDDGGARQVDTYELAAPMSGRHRIPPLRVMLVDDAGAEIEVLTEEVPLTVGSVLAAKTDAQLAAPRPTLATYVGGGPWWPGIIGGGLGVVGLGVGVAILLLSRRAVRRGQISAWELAMRRLAVLEAAGAGAGDAAAIDAWYVELSSVVRAYVEGRFRLRAPELTTEEFLLEARRIPELTAPHRDALGSFLERCDRVKFAGWRPEPAESLETLGAARSFVIETRPVEEGKVAA